MMNNSAMEPARNNYMTSPFSAPIKPAPLIDFALENLCRT